MKRYAPNEEKDELVIGASDVENGEDSARVSIGQTDFSLTISAKKYRYLRVSIYVLIGLLAALLIFGSIVFTPTRYAIALDNQASYGEIILGFQSQYLSESGTYSTHSGIDVAASAGSGIASPVAGTVSFAGSVPSSSVSGSPTTLAVSVTTSDGRIVSLMPFSSISVSEGDYIDVGDIVGILSATGDRSAGAPHLHIGLRVDGKYVDPSYLLGINASKDTNYGEASGDNAGVLAETFSNFTSGAQEGIYLEGAIAEQDLRLGDNGELVENYPGDVVEGVINNAANVTQSIKANSISSGSASDVLDASAQLSSRTDFQTSTSQSAGDFFAGIGFWWNEIVTNVSTWFDSVIQKLLSLINSVGIMPLVLSASVVVSCVIAVFMVKGLRRNGLKNNSMKQKIVRQILRVKQVGNHI